MEKNEEVSGLVGFFEKGETLLFYGHECIRLYDRSLWALHSERLSIEVVYDEIDSGQRLEKCDVFLHEEISSFTLEDLMGLLLNLDDNITWLSVRVSIRLAMEDVLLT